MSTNNYVRFTSTKPRLDFSFLFPEGWQTSEAEERNYCQVFIRGPRNEANTYSTTIVVNVLPAGKMNLEERVADYLAKTGKTRAFKLISTAKGFLSGAEAVELLVSYDAPLPIYNVNATDTKILERRIIVKRGEHFYELTYNAVEEDYDAFLPAFENAARTFEFRDGEAKEFRPVVISVPTAPVPTREPALAIAEKREGYKTKE